MTLRGVSTAFVAGWYNGGKCYPLKSHGIKPLLTHVEPTLKRAVFEDVPEAVHDEVYRKSKIGWQEMSVNETTQLGLKDFTRLLA